MRETQEIMNIYNLSAQDQYQRALRYAQEQFIGPKSLANLTLDTVGDIIQGPPIRRAQRNDLSNPGRQNRVRRDLY